MIFRIELSGGGWGGDRGFKLASLGIFNSTMLCYFPLFLAFPTTLGILLSAPSIPASNAPPTPSPFTTQDPVKFYSILLEILKISYKDMILLRFPEGFDQDMHKSLSTLNLQVFLMRLTTCLIN